MKKIFCDHVRRKVMFKRVISCILTAAIAVNFTGCGGSGALDANGDGAVQLDEFDVELACSQCPGCQEALNCYFELINAASEYASESDNTNYQEDKALDKFNEQLHVALDHDCKSDIIHVENVPYAYYGSLGTYTGSWRGCAPTEKGEYIGTGYFTDGIVNYNGDWVWGLPEGSGELYSENFHRTRWDMTYYGEMMCGYRHGRGTLYEYCKPNEMGYYHRYRFYDETDWDMDVMASETNFEQFDGDTDELTAYGVMIGEPTSCWVDIVEKHDPNNGWKSSDYLMAAIGLTAITATVCYLISSEPYTYESSTPRPGSVESAKELNEYWDRKKAEREERIANEEEIQRQWCENRYEHFHQIYPDDNFRFAQYWKYNRWPKK